MHCVCKLFTLMIKKNCVIQLTFKSFYELYKLNIICIVNFSKLYITFIMDTIAGRNIFFYFNLYFSLKNFMPTIKVLNYYEAKSKTNFSLTLFRKSLKMIKLKNILWKKNVLKSLKLKQLNIKHFKSNCDVYRDFFLIVWHIF